MPEDSEFSRLLKLADKMRADEGPAAAFRLLENVLNNLHGSTDAIHGCVSSSTIRDFLRIGLEMEGYK